MTANTIHNATLPNINITPVILAGGKGLRLRPLTHKERPKHLLKFFAKHSFLQRTLLRVPHLNAPIIICEERHIKATQEQLNAIGCHNARIIAEPKGKSTAIAIALAADLLEKGTMLVLPCDHAIKNEKLFEQIITTVASTKPTDKIILFGAPITKPATRYGYIQYEDQHPILNKVTGFTEKPDKNTAKNFIKTGQYLWNTGIFLTDAAHILKELQTLHPIITKAARAKSKRLSNNILYPNKEKFEAAPAISIDHALMEKTQTAYVTNLGLKWSDTGTWASLILSKFGLF